MTGRPRVRSTQRQNDDKQLKPSSPSLPSSAARVGEVRDDHSRGSQVLTEVTSSLGIDSSLSSPGATIMSQLSPHSKEHSSRWERFTGMLERRMTRPLPNDDYINVELRVSRSGQRANASSSAATMSQASAASSTRSSLTTPATMSALKSSSMNSNSNASAASHASNASVLSNPSTVTSRKSVTFDSETLSRPSTPSTLASRKSLVTVEESRENTVDLRDEEEQQGRTTAAVVLSMKEQPLPSVSTRTTTQLAMEQNNINFDSQDDETTSMPFDRYISATSYDEASFITQEYVQQINSNPIIKQQPKQTILRAPSPSPSPLVGQREAGEKKPPNVVPTSNYSPQRQNNTKANHSFGEDPQRRHRQGTKANYTFGGEEEEDVPTFNQKQDFYEHEPYYKDDGSLISEITGGSFVPGPYPPIPRNSLPPSSPPSSKTTKKPPRQKRHRDSRQQQQKLEPTIPRQHHETKRQPQQQQQPIQSIPTYDTAERKLDPILRNKNKTYSPDKTAPKFCPVVTPPALYRDSMLDNDALVATPTKSKSSSRSSNNNDSKNVSAASRRRRDDANSNNAPAAATTTTTSDYMTLGQILRRLTACDGQTSDLDDLIVSPYHSSEDDEEEDDEDEDDYETFRKGHDDDDENDSFFCDIYHGIFSIQSRKQQQQHVRP